MYHFTKTPSPLAHRCVPGLDFLHTGRYASDPPELNECHEEHWIKRDDEQSLYKANSEHFRYLDEFLSSKEIKI